MKFKNDTVQNYSNEIKRTVFYMLFKNNLNIDSLFRSFFRPIQSVTLTVTSNTYKFKSLFRREVACFIMNDVILSQGVECQIQYVHIRRTIIKLNCNSLQKVYNNSFTLPCLFTFKLVIYKRNYLFTFCI